MTLVSSKEFVNNEDKYFDLAVSERVFVKKGNHTFFIANADEELEEIMEYRNAKSYKGNAIPFEAAFDEIESFISK